MSVGFMEKLRWHFKTIEHKLHQYRHTTNEIVIADTEYGKVKGVKRLTAYDEPYYSFEGIPYAQPPIGELRFKAPQRPTPWQGVRDCTNVKDNAVQLNFISSKVDGSEDCLYLNVYTNNLNPPAPRPVLIWIHGGGYIQGMANRDWYGPDYFMQKDVVLITMQYRLGVLGFLSLNTPTLNIPGNAGLKDQVMAIKWIKNNCASFAGNPDCITVFGESAGAACAHYMMLTDQTQGLFHRGILMSGSAICPWATTDSVKRAFKFAKHVGYKGENNEEDILKFLMNAKAKDLIVVDSKVLTPKEQEDQILFVFGPTVEPYVTPDCVLPKQPREMMKTAWGNSIPVMMGNTSLEGLFFVPETKLNPSVIKRLDTCVSYVPAEIADEERTSEETIEKGLKIKTAHVSDGREPTVENYFEATSYSYFYFPMHRAIQSRFAYGSGAPTYLYRFDFDSEVLIHPYRIYRWGRGIKGVAHADELAYLFWNILAHRIPKDSREYRTIERTVAIWTQFAATGNPFDEKIPGMETLTWHALRRSEIVYKCLNIGDELKVVDLPEMEKIKIWESIFEHKKELLY